jgi:hypothetical protein
MLSARRRLRPGLTLLELLAALATCGVLAAGIARLLDRQQRFHHGVHAIAERRTHLRDATDIVALSLRDVAPAEGDLLAIADTAVEFHAMVGNGVACALGAGGASIVLAPDSLAAGHVLGAFRTAPQAGDLAFVLDEGPTAAASDDRWTPHVLSGVAVGAGACGGSPLLDPARDAARPVRTLALAAGGSLGTTVTPGAAVRVVRRARLRLYRAGSGEWVLGREDWSGAAWTVIQPVSGPFRDPAGTLRGLALRWLDAAGTPVALTSPATVRRVALEAYTRTSGPVRIDGLRHGRWNDSLRVAVALRNRP